MIIAIIVVGLCCIWSIYKLITAKDYYPMMGYTALSVLFLSAELALIFALAS